MQTLIYARVGLEKALAARARIRPGLASVGSRSCATGWRGSPDGLVNGETPPHPLRNRFLELLFDAGGAGL